MSKLQYSTYDIFVKKLENYLGKTLLRSDIFRIWLHAGGSKKRFVYALSKLKHQEKISILGGGIFRVENENKTSPSDEDYWEIVDLLMREHAPSGAIIGHEKSMELHLRNFEVPEILVIYTRDTAKRIQIESFHFHFRTLQSGEKSKKKNMFRLLLESSKSIQVGNHTFHTLGIEASMLDVASIKKHDTGISESLLLKFIKKYENSYSRNILGELVSYRYIRAINRIRALAKIHGLENLYTTSLDIIKKEGGGCYLHL